MKMWVARDKDGELYFHTSKPYKTITGNDYWVSDDFNFQLDDNMFPELKWEDEPLEVEIKEVEK